MTEKIKIALLEWAKKVLNQEAQWDEEKTHEAIQKLYELSIVQKMLLGEETVNNDQWKRQQAQLNEVIESLTGESKKERIKEENMEIAPMMETIKNMVLPVGGWAFWRWWGSKVVIEEKSSLTSIWRVWFGTITRSDVILPCKRISV